MVNEDSSRETVRFSYPLEARSWSALIPLVFYIGVIIALLVLLGAHPGTLFLSLIASYLVTLKSYDLYLSLRKVPPVIELADNTLFANLHGTKVKISLSEIHAIRPHGPILLGRGFFEIVDQGNKNKLIVSHKLKGMGKLIQLILQQNPECEIDKELMQVTNDPS